MTLIITIAAAAVTRRQSRKLREPSVSVSFPKNKGPSRKAHYHHRLTELCQQYLLCVLVLMTVRTRMKFQQQGQIWQNLAAAAKLKKCSNILVESICFLLNKLKAFDASWYILIHSSLLLLEKNQGALLLQRYTSYHFGVSPKNVQFNPDFLQTRADLLVKMYFHRRTLSSMFNFCLSQTQSFTES